MKVENEIELDRGHVANTCKDIQNTLKHVLF